VILKRAALPPHRAGLFFSLPVAWGAVTGIAVGGGAYLAVLAVPEASITHARLLITFFVPGLLQGARSRAAWPWALPLGTIGTVASFIIAAGPDETAPVRSALRLLVYVVVMNTPGFTAALTGLLVRLAGERAFTSARARRPG